MSGTAFQSGNTGFESQSDVDLMAALQDAKGEALEALVRRYGGMIRRVAVGILRDDAEAEDVAQDIFLEVYQKSHLYDPQRGSVRVWLMQYAYHRSLRRKAALRLRAAYRGDPLSAAESLMRGNEQRWTAEECRWILHAGLALLPERQRLTLELVCLHDLSLRDVAERLSVSFGCARHYYYRGLARLRTWAAGCEGDRGANILTPKRRRRTGRRAMAVSEESRVALPVCGAEEGEVRRRPQG